VPVSSSTASTSAKFTGVLSRPVIPHRLMRMYRSLTLTWTRERGERFQTQTPVPTPIVPRTKMTVRTPKLSSAAFVARPREPSAKTPPTKKKSPPRIQLRPGESSTKKLVDASQNRTICRSFRKRAYLRLRSVFILRKTARALMISVDKPATWLDHSLINTSAFFRIPNRLKYSFLNSTWR
jgi:hypothetical protein